MNHGLSSRLSSAARPRIRPAATAVGTALAVAAALPGLLSCCVFDLATERPLAGDLNLFVGSPVEVLQDSAAAPSPTRPTRIFAPYPGVSASRRRAPGSSRAKR